MNPPREAPAWLWMRQAATQSLAAAGRDPAAGSSLAMSALIHTALMAEIFFDRLGAHIDRDWSGKARRFSKYKRLRVFRLALGIAGDIKARPWRSVADAFDFHDLVVYGSIDASERCAALELSEAQSASPAGDWRAFATVENARRILGDVEAAIVELHRTAGMGEDAFACKEQG